MDSGRKELNVGCWNKITLVESDSSIGTGVTRQGGQGEAKERKMKLLVAGTLDSEDEVRPTMLEGGEVECVTYFK